MRWLATGFVYCLGEEIVFSLLNDVSRRRNDIFYSSVICPNL